MAKLTDHRKTIQFFETLDKDKEVETEQSEDETTDDETDEDESTEGETEDETEDEDESESDDDESETDDDEEAEDEDAEFDKRFTQLKGETLTEYKDSLETAYAESTNEGIRLKGLLDKTQPAIEALSKIIAKHPELAEEVGSVETSTESTEFPKDPTQAILAQQVKDTQTKEYSEFNKKLLDNGIDIEADPTLANELNSALAVIRDHVWRSERRIVGMGEGLERAWKLMGKEIEDPKDKLRNAAKKVAGQKRTAGGKKVKSGASLTEEQRKVAEKFGLDPKKVARHVTN